MSKIKLTTDSTSDLSDEQIKQSDIAIIPLYVNFSTQSFKDNVDISTKELYRKVSQTGALPSTSAPTPADFSKEFKKYIEKGMDILHVSISSKISAAYQNACAAAEQFPSGRIKVIDSFNLSSGIGILVMSAADCIEKGLSLDDTVKAVKDQVEKVETEFIVDTVEYLYKGGRCSGVQMILSSLLKIHPIIEVSDGSMHLTAKIRGSRQNVLNRLVNDTTQNLSVMDHRRIFITHSESDEDAVWIKKQLEGLNKFKEVLITNASCVISSHCGPKTIGIIGLKNR
jgi:DegV family protein with EDD domain